MRYSCEEGDDSAEGFAVGEEGEGDVGRAGLVGVKRRMDLMYMFGRCGVLYYWALGLLHFGAVRTEFLEVWFYGGFLGENHGLVRIHQC